MKNITTLEHNAAAIPLEMKLSILCTEYPMTEETGRNLPELLQEPVDWDIFYKIIIKNRIFPVVYHNLKKLSLNKIDRHVLSELEAAYKNNQLSSLRLTNDLIKLTELLKKHNIRVLSIKGPVLAMSLYQDISLRASKDLDILAAPSDIAGIDKLLLEAGYTKDSQTAYLSFKQEKHYFKMYHHYTYYNNGVQLELHWRLSGDYYNIPFQETWRNHREIVMFGKSINILSEEDNLIYLILHGSRHAWKRLRWLCDINDIIKNKTLDWNYIIKRARKLGILHLLEQTLLLLAALFKLQPQIQLHLTAKDRRLANRLALMSLSFINSLDGEAELPGHSLFLGYKKYKLVWCSGIREKIRYLAGHLTPGIEDFETLKLQDKYFFIYYILRFYKIMKRCFTYLFPSMKERGLP